VREQTSTPKLTGQFSDGVLRGSICSRSAAFLCPDRSPLLTKERAIPVSDTLAGFTRLAIRNTGLLACAWLFGVGSRPGWGASTPDGGN